MGDENSDFFSSEDDEVVFGNVGSDFARDGFDSSEISDWSTDDEDTLEMRCSRCDKVFYSLTELRSHMIKKHLKKSRPSSPKQIIYRRKKEKNKKKAKKKKKEKEKGSSSNIVESKEGVGPCLGSNIRLCSRCTYISKNANEYAEHRRVCDFDEKTCCFCGGKFDSAISKSRHEHNCVRNREAFICRFCSNFSSKHRSALQRHINEKHTKNTNLKGVNVHSCRHCGKTFSRPDNLKIHKSVCKNNPKNFSKDVPALLIPCKVCGREYQNAHTLKAHELQCAIKCVCELCKQKFANAKFLKSHKQHCPKLQSTCKYCGKVCNRYDLMRHQSTCKQKQPETSHFDLGCPETLLGSLDRKHQKDRNLSAIPHTQYFKELIDKCDGVIPSTSSKGKTSKNVKPKNPSKRVRSNICVTNLFGEQSDSKHPNKSFSSKHNPNIAARISTPSTVSSASAVCNIPTQSTNSVGNGNSNKRKNTTRDSFECVSDLYPIYFQPKRNRKNETDVADNSSNNQNKNLIHPSNKTKSPMHSRISSNRKNIETNRIAKTQKFKPNNDSDDEGSLMGVISKEETQTTPPAPPPPTPRPRPRPQPSPSVTRVVPTPKTLGKVQYQYSEDASALVGTYYYDDIDYPLHVNFDNPSQVVFPPFQAPQEIEKQIKSLYKQRWFGIMSHARLSAKSITYNLRFGTGGFDLSEVKMFLTNRIYRRHRYCFKINFSPGFVLYNEQLKDDDNEYG
ncbi:MAG: hypothetical protein GY705_18585 [Bacteroidetes bacterium]|nr:hypothetical protein [Bacteroidota bacterium]